MEIRCADCGCVVERGVRVIPCETAECCCLELPLTDPMVTLAARTRIAFNARDVDTFRGLIADDATWGDDPGHDSYCHSRNDIIATLEQLLDSGVTATMVEATPGPNGVAVVLDVEWPARETWRPERQQVFQSYRVTDGKVAEIRGHDDRDSALASISH